MVRAFWKGHLSFGLVEIPVTLKSAISRAEEIHFSLLGSNDFSAVGYRRCNKESGAEVPWERAAAPARRKPARARTPARAALRRSA